MARWQLSVDVDTHAEQAPVFARIGRAISDDISRGRLRAGQRLPGTRKLAESLGVHRNTVVRALDELVAQGWLTTARARGTFVAGVPEPRAAGKRRPPGGLPAEPGFPLRGDPPAPRVSDGGPGVLALAGGRPDPRLFPAALFTRAHRRAVLRHGHEALDYGDPRGEEPLRAALAAMLSERRGLAVARDDVLVTRGAQMALWLAGRALLEPGDAVAVERFGYPPAWSALRDAGAELVPVDVDADGVDVARLERLAAEKRLRAVYVTPHHQFPTMVTLKASRRLELLELARKHHLAVIEDDYDNEYHYEGRPVLPLASMDRHGSVVYVGTLSKVLAPGLRIGFVVAPRPLLERMTAIRVCIDRQGDRATERAVAELMDDGEIQRHAWRMRRVYQKRRDALVTALRGRLGGVVDFDVPPGGLALWARVRAGIDVERWAERALARGVSFQPGGGFAFDGGQTSAARFGFARLGEDEIDLAVRGLEAALRTERA